MTRRALALAAALSALAAAPPAGAAEGTSGDDRVRLGDDDDRYRAGAGDDRVRGGGGDDDLAGQAGNDKLRGDAGSDALRGGAGDDVILARDGTADAVVSGGGGEDRCVVDAEDAVLKSCETIEAPGPPDPPDSFAFANRNWAPTSYDTCPKALHDSYYVVGPDGKRYPGWHPPRVTDPDTGELCTFGHEHGRDPAGSEIYEWATGHLSDARYPDHLGIPFAYVSEQLDEYAAANPGQPTRHEDHVGHKIDWINDVELLDEHGRYVTTEIGGVQTRVECDFLFKVHQGSHSPDATINNAHELVYASRCNDGAEILASTMSTFGAPNEFNRACAPGQVVDSQGTSPLPSGPGDRLIPDRACAEQYVLVDPDNPAAYSSTWAIYENWRSWNELETAGGERLAFYDPWFAVFDPSRYYDAAQQPAIGRTVDLSWETEANGDVANRPPWTLVADLEPFPAQDPRSPFDGAEREFYLGQNAIANAGGPERWYTDPWGGNGSTEPFRGAVCQLVGQVDTSGYPELRQRLFRRGADYGVGEGVHAPN